MAAFDTGGRHGRRKWRRRLIARQLRLVRTLRGTFICDDETECAHDRDEPGSMKTEAMLHAHDPFFRPPVSYLKPIICLAMFKFMLELPVTRSSSQKSPVTHARNA